MVWIEVGGEVCWGEGEGKLEMTQLSILGELGGMILL